MSFRRTALLLALSLPMAAQAPSTPSTPWTMSTEADLVAFASGGWYASLAAGKGAWRGRAVVAEVHPPDRFAPEGFEAGRVRAVALLADRFFRPGFRGPWVGGGLEGWEERYRQQGAGTEVQLRSLQATLGAGWVFDLGHGFTVNPWGALHQRLAGDREAATATAVCQPPALTGEVSVKVGFAW